MRDLFQVVFELKKKEMDEAKQQLGRDKSVKLHRKSVATSCSAQPNFQQLLRHQSLSGQQPDLTASTGGAASFGDNDAFGKMQQQQQQPGGGGGLGGGLNDLLGLESEMANLQAGIQQIDKITPANTAGKI